MKDATNRAMAGTHPSGATAKKPKPKSKPYRFEVLPTYNGYTVISKETKKPIGMIEREASNSKVWCVTVKFTSREAAAEFLYQRPTSNRP